MVFVTVNCAPITAGSLVEPTQVAGGVKLSVACSVNPNTFVAQERIRSFPLGLAFRDTVLTSRVPRSATV